MKYTTEIPGNRWLVLALMSDLGWLAYIGGFAFYLVSGADGLGTVTLSAVFLLNCLAVLAVIIGIIDIVFQRIRRLNRTISRNNLIFGFGFTVYGALSGFLLSAAAVVIDILFHYETGRCFAAQIIMAVGALLCFAFRLPILRSFKPEKDQ